VISDAGAHNTMRLLPSGEVDYGWAQDITELEASTGYIGLYLGLSGDIARRARMPPIPGSTNRGTSTRAGTTPSGSRARRRCSSPSLRLRDPSHEPGPQKRHSCEIVALVDWSVFSRWDRSEDADGMPAGAARDRDYAAVKDR
jgi:all-trans-retinol 13,14-reductase